MALLTLPVLSLERASFVKIAIHLWKFDTSISQAFPESCNDIRGPWNVSVLESKWSEIENAVCGKVDRMALPPSFKYKTRAMAKSIGREILEWLKWKAFKVLGHGIWVKLVDSIQFIEWTTRGKVDATKTARALTKLDKTFTLNQRYRIACLFCIKDTIEALWQEFSEFEFNHCRTIGKALSFWSDVMTRVSVSKYRKFELLFLFVSVDNVSGVNHLWSMFTEEERNEYADTKLRPDKNTKRINCYFVSQLNERQLNNYFVYSSGLVLIFKQFLEDWVYIDLFVGMADRFLARLDAWEVRDLLLLTAQQISKDPHDARYKMCFAHLLANTSSELKENLIYFEMSYPACCIALHEAQDFVSVNLMLKSASEEDRNMILSGCVFLINGI